MWEIVLLIIIVFIFGVITGALYVFLNYEKLNAIVTTGMLMLTMRKLKPFEEKHEEHNLHEEEQK